MNKISIKYISLICCLYLTISGKCSVTKVKTPIGLNISKPNLLENALIGQGLQIPVTASWQLLLIILSDSNCGLSLAQAIKELSESRRQIEEDLLMPHKFHLHPAVNISSSILVRPRSEFLDFVIAFVGTLNLTALFDKKTPLLTNEKRGIIACNSMIKNMVKDNFVQRNMEHKYTAQNISVSLEISIDNLCEEYLANLKELFNMLVIAKKGLIRNMYTKVLMYNRICRLLGPIGN
ncbi:hypothetical protein OIY81_957 [Cryptosporidium canis]|uniref:Uncharacterized protein n=1 Tax=Cryptosporidium canis TaxID=195482 RepID=A0ABQ8P5E1_9CRYT|nr:hypothetical protein OJ252_2375 [Cryptosporidium canis]KAJ1613428.1 hypothetical protein OIY81_957 [Cryptosporidium canis]